MSKQELGGTFTRNDERPTNIKPATDEQIAALIEKHGRRRVAIGLALTFVFSPVILLGGAYAMCEAMFAVGYSLVQEIFED